MDTNISGIEFVFIRVHSWFNLLPAQSQLGFVGSAGALPPRPPPCSIESHESSRINTNLVIPFVRIRVIRGYKSHRYLISVPSTIYKGDFSDTQRFGPISAYSNRPNRGWPVSTPGCLSPIARPICSISPEIVAQQSQFGLGIAPLICHNRGLRLLGGSGPKTQERGNRYDLSRFGLKHSVSS